MDKEKQKCPYCSRKINYKTRLTEHGEGEHNCPHCKKTSRITQNSNIWILLILCCLVAAFIMVFYFTASDNIQEAFENEGKFGFLVALFFGSAKEIKWMIWEMVPFAVFLFISPMFIEYLPLKRFMEQTPSSIDLTVPSRTVTSGRSDKPTGRTRIIPKAQPTQFTGEYEDISSSSEGMDKTRAFDMYSPVESRETADSEEYTDVTPVPRSKSDSYSSNTPLKKVNHEQVREYTPRSENVRTDRPVPRPESSRNRKPASTGNYSGNRKF